MDRKDRLDFKRYRDVEVEGVLAWDTSKRAPEGGNDRFAGRMGVTRERQRDCKLDDARIS
jgi:hypothetical protein